MSQDHTGLDSDAALNPTITLLLQVDIHTKQLLVITFDQSRLIGLTLLHPCKISRWVILIAAVIGIAVLNIVMLVRVHALWPNSRIAPGMAILLFLFNIITFISVLCHVYTTAIIIPSAPPFTGCLFLANFKSTYLIFIGLLVFETYVIALILAKCVPIALKRRVKSPLSTVLMTDRLIYYIVVLAFQVLDIIIGLTGNFSLVTIVIRSYPVTALVGVACNRLLIRLQSKSLMPELDLDMYSEDS
ncbi:hypothetical protein CPB86DRAFT_798816 [Serendipita vermifera]|nr:hypothetical protein CPB86DRAFT_798816 [Serendipita vermifera]